jgi:hypothetical protein
VRARRRKSQEQRSFPRATKSLGIDPAALKLPGPRDADSAKLGLRFDKVAARLLDRLQAAVTETAPGGVTVLLTITAPIRLPSKTASALEDKIQTLLAAGPGPRDYQDSIHGNRVRIRVLKHGIEQAPKTIGFVHNPGSDPLLLFDIAQEALKSFDANTAAGAAE